jgi:Protein of unknown function (DUF3604)
MTKRGSSALPVTVTLLALLGSAFWWMARSPGAAIRPGMQTEPALSFKITFGLKQKLHGRVWTGVLRNPAQIRSVRGWHLDVSDSITLPDRWNLSLRTVGGETPSKAVILDVLSPPGQPVVIYTREGDISFTPARVSYGVTHYIPESNGDRHSAISMDGAIDGSLWDLYRYALNAASFDFIAVTDHNYGAWLDTDEPESKNTDDVYQWWRTQKSADIFHIPGRFVPLYGYERSVNFPLGHRNIFHVRRGIFSYRVPKLHIAERADLITKDAQGLWAYLRATDGVALPHTSGTTMGTDWSLRDDALEPVTEIYQGDRNSYEEEGATRAALSDNLGLGVAGRQPFQKGLVWNALGAGYRMGFVASSDHFSTHISYANLLVPDRVTTRADIQQAFRRRHTYASTDNIVVDFYAGETLQGGDLEAAASPTFHVAVRGTEPILRVELIKNNRLIYTRGPEPGAVDARVVTFSFRDSAEFGGAFNDTTMHASSQIKDWSRPETGIRPRPAVAESYYYVRVVQSFSREKPALEGEIGWSSPIFVRRK